MSRSTTTTSSTGTQSKTTPPAPMAAAPATQTGIPQEKIAKRAYEKWLKGGCKHGCDQQHWYEAEAELRAEMTKSGTQGRR